MECLDANQVQDLMAGELDAAQRASVLGHLDTCEDCRELLGFTAREELASPLHRTQPYPDQIVAPRDAAGDVDALGATADASDAVGLTATRKPSAKLIPPRDTTTVPPAATSEHQFGRYELIERIGAGAMGVVWRAHDPKLGRRVALKLLKRRDVTLTERLVREAQAMAQVNHENVVAVYDVGTAQGATYIAMELVQGKSLRAWQTAERRTITELVRAYVAAGRGLAAAHGAGIVHRDFKADNVLVADDGRVRVTDFGLAAAKFDQIQRGGSSADESDEDAVQLTRSGALLGTPSYMAPEQFTGGNVDPRTDQFNFCASLYEALYGERAFAGAKLGELSENVVAGRVKPPPPRAQVSRGLRAILLRGLAAKPADRFPSMDHLLAQLGRDRARPWWRGAVVCAALAVVLVLGVVSDWAVRSRVSAQIRQSFALTGSQLDLTSERLRDFFNDSSRLALREPSVVELQGFREQADFGLGSPADDRERLQRLHDTFVSADLPKLGHAQLAILDYKGRLMYSSYAPSAWDSDLSVLPQIRAALDAGTGQSLSVLPYAALAPTRLLGSAPRTNGLVLMFLQTLTVGGRAGAQDGREARAIWLVLEDGELLLRDLRIDSATQLALVAPDGTAIGDPEITPALIAAAQQGSGAVTVGDREALAWPLAGLGGPGSQQAPVATVVMARRLDGVLVLFPGARVVFALAALIALALAAVFTWRARRIAQAQAQW